MTQLELVSESVDPATELATFFATLDQCSDKSSLTHSLHPYPAKFIPHIPRELIRAYSEVENTVWDPMCGSGTTLVEAAVARRVAIGTDINPIAALVSRAKTTPIGGTEAAEIDGLARRLERAARAWAGGTEDLESVEPPDFPNRDHWFQPQASRELAQALRLIDVLSSPAAHDLARCAFSAILVPVSNQESETRWRARPNDPAPGSVLSRLAAKLRTSLASVEAFGEAAGGATSVMCADARYAGLDDSSVDLVVTSPPYANSHDYYLYNKLRLFWLGYPVAPVQAAEIGSRNRHSDLGESITTYLTALSEIFRDVVRVLRSAGIAVFVVADAVIRGEFFSMDDLLPRVAAPVGLVLKDAFAFEHRRFNRVFQKGFGTKRQKATHVLVFRRA